jgi:CheY-like chemotaxis protein
MGLAAEAGNLRFQVCSKAGVRMPVVLVVDDHPGVAGAVAALLRSSGFDAEVVHSGGEALAFLRNHPVDFMLLDLSMPGMSGLDVLRALRADGDYPDAPPVAMLSAGEHGRDESLQLGAVAFVDKADADKLPPLIERYLKAPML